MPAIVLLHMAAQDRCSAVTNVREGFPLLRGEHVSPLSQKIIFVGAENIGQFEPISWDAALDEVRLRFGSAAITRAVLLGRRRGLAMPLLPD